VISLTEPGSKHLQTYWPQFQAAVSAAFGDLPAQQQEQLLVITPLLTQALRNRTRLAAGDLGPSPASRELRKAPRRLPGPPGIIARPREPAAGLRSAGSVPRRRLPALSHEGAAECDAGNARRAGRRPARRGRAEEAPAWSRPGTGRAAAAKGEGRGSPDRGTDTGRPRAVAARARVYPPSPGARQEVPAARLSGCAGPCPAASYRHSTRKMIAGYSKFRHGGPYLRQDFYLAGARNTMAEPGNY
jgi:hypothetical protein